MEASIEKQRASVRKQLQSAQPAEPSFFTVPWVLAASAPDEPVIEPDCEPVPPEELGALIDEISEREGLTPDLLRAVIQQESGFRPCAISRKGAQGLMQLMPATAEQLGIMDPFNPRQNIDGGARFLRQLLDRYGGDLNLALGAYNAGPGWVDVFGGVPLFPETLNYVLGVQEKLKTK